MTRWTAPLVLFGLALSGLALFASSAAAEPDPAKRLFDEGRALAAKGKHLEACVLFEKSYELEAAVGTQLNLADCAERDGNPRKAWVRWTAAAEEFERMGDPRAKFAHGRADALAPKLAAVVVKLARPRTRKLVVRIAGREVAPAREILERVEPGVIAVSVSAPCCKAFEATITAELGKQVELAIPKLERLAGGTDPEEDEAPTGRGWRTSAIISGAAMAAFAGGTLYSYLKVNDAEDRIGNGAAGQDLIDATAQGERYETVANVCQIGFFVAAAVTAVSIYKAVTTHDTPSNGAAWHVSPVIAPTAAGAAFGFDW
ncbi:MAG: hypothetical protein WKG01_29070 [Kofleriaceae bacterium]